MDIFDYQLNHSTPPSYYDLMRQLEQPSFRAKQLAQWLWVSKQSNYAHSYDDMTNLPADLRKQLEELAPLNRGVAECVQRSKDGTRKYLIRFADGVQVEAVGLPAFEPGHLGRRSSPANQGNDSDGSNGSGDNTDVLKRPKRLTVCLSTQAGCAMGCIFCATGKSGLIRDLTPGEIAEQVRIIGEDFKVRISNVVAMGQGEALQNYDATLAGLRILNAPESEGGFGIGARHITISTSGIIKGIKQLQAEPEQFTLAVSLHSAIQATRNLLMPGLKTQTLPQLKEALMDYFETTQRRPSLEYALVHKTNTTPEEIAALVHFARETRAHVNLIPLNETGSKFKMADNVETMHTAKVLRAEGIEATVRMRRGADIDAACGQLKQRLQAGHLIPKHRTEAKGSALT